MKQTRSQTFIHLALTVLTLGPLSAQDFTSVTFESHDIQEQETMRGQMHFRDNMLRIDGAAGSQSGHYSMIFRGDRDLLWFLVHDTRQYIEMNQQTMEQMSNQISAILAQFQEQLEILPPEERDALAAMLKGRIPEPDTATTSAPEIRRTEKRKEISGYPCVRYDVYQDGARMAEVWATSRSTIPGAENLNAVFQGLADLYRSLTEGFAQFQTGFNFNMLAELDGFPIRILNFEDGQLRNKMLIQEISSGSGVTDLFERPSDYTEEKMGFPR